MHIAIYSYKVADRKQMERLMDRESDKWIKEGNPIYAYSFGSVESLLASTMTYDAVLVDMCETDSVSAAGLIEKYKSDNIHTRIIECADEVSIGDYLEDNFFLQKPILTADLHNVMLALSEKIKTNKVKIELHTDGGTEYIDEEEFMYAVHRGSHIEIHLADNRVYTIFGSAESLYYGMSTSYPTIVLPSKSAVLNIRYVTKMVLHVVTMVDGTKIKVSGSVAPYIKEAMNLLKDGSTEAMERLSHMDD